MLDRNCYYNRIHLIFLKQNPSINSFDLYRSAWEYLKDSAKFQSITMALKSTPHAAERKGKSDVSKELSESDVAPSSAVTRAARAMGQKKSKRREEEEKIAGNVVDAIRGSMQAGEGNNSASAVLAAALGSFTTLISKSLKSWQEHQSYSNADPDLRKKYDNLLLTQRINAMEMASGTAIGGRFSTPIASHNNVITPAHADAEVQQQESGMVERNHNNKSNDGAVERNNNAVVERNHNNNKSNDGAVERNNNAVIERNHNNKSEMVPSSAIIIINPMTLQSSATIIIIMIKLQLKTTLPGAAFMAELLWGTADCHYKWPCQGSVWHVGLPIRLWKARK